MHVKWCGCFDVIRLQFIYGNLLSFLMLYTSFRMDRWNFLQTVGEKVLSFFIRSGAEPNQLVLSDPTCASDCSTAMTIWQREIDRKLVTGTFCFFFLTERWNKSVRLRPGQERGSRGRGVLRGLHLPNGKTLHAGSWKGAYTKTIRETDCNIPREWLGLTDCWGNQEAMKTTCIHVNLGQWSTSFPSRSPSRRNALGTRLDSGMDFAETATGCNYLSLLP